MAWFNESFAEDPPPAPPQTAGITRAPWDGGGTRREGDGTWGRGEWSYWYQCQKCLRWFDRKLKPGFFSLSQAVACQDCRTIPVEGPKIPAGYRRAGLGDFGRVIRAEIDGWIAAGGQILLSGPSGVGKTHACHAVRAAAWHLKNPRMVLYLDLPEARGRWAGDPTRRELLVQSWSSARWAILDDLSATTATEGWAEAVHRLIDHRLSGRLPTIVTSASSIEEIGASGYGLAVARRLGEFGIVRMSRKKGGKKCSE